MPKLKFISVFSLCLILSGVLLGFSIDRSRDGLCTELAVHVGGDGELHFVSQESIREYLNDHGHIVVGDSMPNIDTKTMEADLEQLPYLNHVEVYKTIDRVVHVEVNQRKPVMRVVFQDGVARYVDESGEFIPLSKDFSFKCLPVTGVDSLAGLIAAKDIHAFPKLKPVWNMSRFIQGDEFWSAQIIQVDLDKEYGLVLIPRVGNHQIIMGDAENFHAKLGDLKTFYDKGIEQTNWNIYRSLDLRYEGQVVGIKR